MYTILIVATLLTSLISGVLSMAGGILLMGVFGFFLPVPAAMVLHGVPQTTSNGSRVWWYRHHIRWAVLPPYFAGASGPVLNIFYVKSRMSRFEILGTKAITHQNAPAGL